MFAYICHEEKHLITDILASLVKQLVENSDIHSPVFRYVSDIYTHHTQRATLPSDTELIELLKKFSLFNKVYVILNALDKALASLQDHLITGLVDLKASLLITSRPMPTLNVPDDTVHVAIENQNYVDITTFLYNRVQKSSYIKNVMQG